MNNQIIKKLFGLAIFLILTFQSNAQSVSWAKSVGGNDRDNGKSVAVDDSGNVYITGSFYSSTITFGTTTLTNTGSSDIFLTKYDSNGSIIWSKSAGGTNYDCGNSITVDHSGNVYITGYFGSPTITFGTTTLTNIGDGDIFVTKYDSNGNVIWAKSTGETGSEVVSSIVVDKLGNVYITGNFVTLIISFGTNISTANGGNDIYLTKYDSNGNVIWTKRSGGINFARGTSAAVDNSGNVVITGYFISPTITFGTNTLSNASFDEGYSDVFIVKFDSNGNVIWAKSAGGTNYDHSNSIAVDSSGNVYIAGYFNAPTIVFGSSTLTSTGFGDIYLTKYDSNGNVIWSKSGGGTGFDNCNSIAVDNSGDIYLTGDFESPTIAFDSTTLTKSGKASSDIYLTKYDSNGDVIWATSNGGIYRTEVYSVAVYGTDNIYLTGFYNSLSKIFGDITLTNAGEEDIFIVKYTQTFDIK